MQHLIGESGTSEAEADLVVQARMAIEALIEWGPKGASAQLPQVFRDHVKQDEKLLSKNELLRVLGAEFAEHPDYQWLRKLLTKKPIRSLSGITSITVLTKPYPCPGKCIFCPADVRMPKSYIATEPGAQRAGRLGFDPYLQVSARLAAYEANGHPTGKIEFIVLGGTWSHYPREYQIWFLKRMFDALNDFSGGGYESTDARPYKVDWQDELATGESYNTHIRNSPFLLEERDESAALGDLHKAQLDNEGADAKCVGLSLETRPDRINRGECYHLRSLGATKIQIGIQSTDDRVLTLNKRGHDIASTRQAFALLRSFGFKVHAHWMPNLYGSTADNDIVDFDNVFGDNALRPDELKIYPCSLIKETELEQLASDGRWAAYDEPDLNRVLAHAIKTTPEYCRLTRIIRDIPSKEILAGNKRGNLRQIVEATIDKADFHDIRSREVRGEVLSSADLILDDQVYETDTTIEHFLQFIRSADRKLAAFLRLSLPVTSGKPVEPVVPELAGNAIIREVHVYGQSVNVGEREEASQHRGLGSALIEAACEISKECGFSNLAVISATGTRPYYEKLGFVRGELYQHKRLT